MQGTIKIRKGTEFQEPMVVYVSQFSKRWGCWITDKLNTGETLLTEEANLVDFNYRDFKIMYYKWKIQRQDIVKKNFIKSLAEWTKI